MRMFIAGLFIGLNFGLIAIQIRLLTDMDRKVRDRIKFNPVGLIMSGIGLLAGGMILAIGLTGG